MGNDHSHGPSGPRLSPVAENFWNVRGSFTAFKILSIGTHMSVIKLPKTGKFLLIDTIPLDAQLKTELDTLTNDGADIEAIIATHPFHTLSFPEFFTAYPKAPFYGCPRHLRIQKAITWTGDISQHLDKWEEHGVEFRIPAGAEFIAPQPEQFNHFSSVWCFFKPAKAIHVDDTINYYTDPGLPLKAVGIKKGRLQFHPSIDGPGLYETQEGPQQFKAWVSAIINDWDFDIICCAHCDLVPSGGKQMLIDCLTDATPLLDKLSKRNAKKKPKKVTAESDKTYKECTECNVDGGTECG